MHTLFFNWEIEILGDNYKDQGSPIKKKIFYRTNCNNDLIVIRLTYSFTNNLNIHNVSQGIKKIITSNKDWL